MASENYIVINGKKAELTEEQLRQLGIKLHKASSFNRAQKGEEYCAILCDGTLDRYYESNDYFDNGCFNVANYCTDRDLMQQRAWHETLSRLLWRYSMEHDGDKIDWNNGNTNKYYICQEGDINKFRVNSVAYVNDECTHFYTRETAENAIEEIIKPFMEEHPDFVW